MNNIIKAGIIMPAISAFFILVNITSATAQHVPDKDIKKNAVPVNNSMSYLAKLQPVSYQFDNSNHKQLNLPAGTHFGFIADDVKQVLPTVVSRDSKWFTAGKNDHRSITVNKVDLEKMVPLLVAALQEQQAELEQLKQTVEQLKAAK